MSKTMNPVEQNYRIPDKEALAIIKGLQNWRHWLKCTQLLVHILTDHKNLESFAKPKIFELKADVLAGTPNTLQLQYKIHY